MLVVKLVGGLASQLHKFAVGLSISRDIGCELFVDCTYFDKQRNDFNPIMIYGLPNLGIEPAVANMKTISLARGYSFIWRFLYQISYSNFINKCTNSNAKRAFNFIEKKASRIIQTRKSSFFVHVSSSRKIWKNELIKKYFGQYYLEGEFGMDFSLIYQLREELKMRIHNCQTASVVRNYINPIFVDKKNVAVHVRRGDYVKSESINKFHGTCGIDYYHVCINELNKKNDNLNYLFFSDDIDWVKKEFSDYLPEFYTFVEGKSAAEDFIIMTMCDYHIIANSGFSSFAAWLSMVPDANIYSPSRWFNDEKTNENQMAILPGNWNYR